MFLGWALSLTLCHLFRLTFLFISVTAGTYSFSKWSDSTKLSWCLMWKSGLDKSKEFERRAERKDAKLIKYMQTIKKTTIPKLLHYCKSKVQWRYLRCSLRYLSLSTSSAWVSWSGATFQSKFGFQKTEKTVMCKSSILTKCILSMQQ